MSKKCLTWLAVKSFANQNFTDQNNVNGPPFLTLLHLMDPHPCAMVLWRSFHLLLTNSAPNLDHYLKFSSVHLFFTAVKSCILKSLSNARPLAKNVNANLICQLVAFYQLCYLKRGEVVRFLFFLKIRWLIMFVHLFHFLQDFMLIF